jgi:hypothetical protein
MFLKVIHVFVKGTHKYINLNPFLQYFFSNNHNFICLEDI